MSLSLSLSLSLCLSPSLSSLSLSRAGSRCLSLSHTGQFLACSYADASLPMIQIFDTVSGNEVFSLPSRYTLQSLAFNPKNMILAYAGEEGDKSDKRPALCFLQFNMKP